LLRQARRRPVNGGGERRAELDDVARLKKGEVLLLDVSAVAGELAWPRSAAALAAGEKNAPGGSRTREG
jgi:hypothetical protein